jgi:hypothetical protein
VSAGIWSARRRSAISMTRTCVPWWRQIVVEVNGLSRPPSSVTVNGQPAQVIAGRHPAALTTNDAGNGIDIAIR